MTNFSMAPLFRQSIGFDRFNDLFESALRNDANGSFPPYNVEKHGDDEYRIIVAAAGFQESDLDLQVERCLVGLEAAHGSLNGIQRRSLQVRMARVRGSGNAGEAAVCEIGWNGPRAAVHGDDRAKRRGAEVPQAAAANGI